MARLQAIFFDGYRTVLHVPDPFGNIHQALLAAGCDAPLPAVITALKGEMCHYRDRCHEAKDEASLLELRNECGRLFAQGLRREGVKVGLPNEVIAAMLVERFRFELYEDAVPTMSALRALGLRLGIISNFDYRLPQLLDELGLKSAFDFVLTSARESPKPGSAIFLKALQLAGVSAAEAWHVGDEWELDMRAAEACGLRGILLVRDGESALRESTQISSLRELVRMAAAARREP